MSANAPRVFGIFVLVLLSLLLSPAMTYGAGVPPIAQPAGASTITNTQVSVSLQFSDPDSSSLTGSIVSPPAHGTLSGLTPVQCLPAGKSGGNLCFASVQYTPAAGFTGTDTFTFKANDGASDSNIATATIIVVAPPSSTPPLTKGIQPGGSPGAPNVAPVAASQAVATPLNTALSLSLVAMDADSPSLTFIVVTPPAHGSLSLLGAPVCTPNGAGANCSAGVVYTPTIGYTGPDSFTFKANDGALDSNLATVGVTVSSGPVNAAPVSNPLNAGTALNTPRALTLSASDADSPVLSFSIVFTPVHGSLGPLGAAACTPVGAGANCTAGVTYTPTTGYIGSDSFSFKTNDGSQDSNIATVTLTVTAGPPPNQAPTASLQSVSVAFNTAKTISLSGADSDSPSLTFAIVTPPAHGGLGAIGAPACVPAGAGTNCTASVTYTPTGGYSGPDSFSFRTNDGALNSNVASVSVTVSPAPPNTAPSAAPQSVTTAFNTAKPITLAASDTDSPSLTFSIVTPPSHGTLSPLGVPACVPAGSGSNCTVAVTYTPTTGYSGPDSFSFKANDGSSDSNVATVNITVSAGPVNAAPTATPQTTTTTFNTAKALTLAAADTDSAALTFSIVTAPSHGNLTPLGAPVCLPAGSGSNCTVAVTYTPTTGYSGPDSFSFKANDGSSDSNVANVSITVSAAVATHLAVVAPSTAANGSAFSFTVTAQDVSNTTVTGYSGTVHFTSSDNALGRVLPADYTFVAGDAGTHSFNATLVTPGDQTLTATDLALLTGTSGNILVGPVPSPPSITKSFGVASIPLSIDTTLSFSITNPNVSAALAGVAFTDTLPAGLVVSTPNGLTGSCGGGTITAVAGAGSVALSGATLAGAGNCAFSVNVTGATAGVKNNSVTVSSTNGGNGNTSNASLTVVGPPSIVKAFGAASIALNAGTTLQFTITNPNTASALTSVGFTDTLPSGLVVSTPNGLTALTGCGGGTATAVAASNSVSLFGATIVASGSCSFTLNVTGISGGPQDNTTGNVTSANGGNGNTASASVSVAVGAPVITKSFTAATIPLNGSTSLSFSITNPNVSTALTGVAFTDTLPAGLVVATPNNLTALTGCGAGSATAVAASSNVSLASATIAGGGTCSFSVSVTGSTAGAKNNSVSVNSTNGGAGNTSNASVTVVGPPSISKSFGGATVAINSSTTLQFTIQNNDPAVALAGVALTDTLPAGLVVATPNGLTALTGCGGGTATAVAASSSVSLSGATIAASGSCSFTVNVTATAAGPQDNTTGNVTSTNGGNGNTASASITVTLPLPVATDDSYTATGNVGLNVTPAANGVLQHGSPDTLNTGALFSYGVNGTEQTSIGSATPTSGGGTVSVNADGTFTYEPPAGKTAADTFKYKLHNVTGDSNIATVTITPSNMIWFIDSSAASCTTLASQCGRLANPFSTIDAFQAINDDAAGHGKQGQVIFISTGSGYSDTTALTLLNTQFLVGQGSSASISSITGLSLAPFSNTLPSVGGISPAISSTGTVNTLVLASLGGANTVRGINLGNGGANSLFGNTFGTLSLTEVNINNTTGAALNLTSGTANATFGTLTGKGITGAANAVHFSAVGGSTTVQTGGALTNSTGADVLQLISGTANFTYPGTITNSVASAQAVLVQTNIGGTIGLSGQITDTGGTGKGVLMTGNSAGVSLNFTGGLNLSTSANAAFTATGGGTVSATQNNTSIINTLTSSTGTALNVANTTIGASGLTFRSITSNGSANNAGIVMDNTGSNAGLTVTGTGSAGTGGTIANKTGADILTGTDAGGQSAGGTNGTGIFLRTTVNPSFSWMQLNDFSNFAIYGNNVTGFTLDRSAISGSNGTNNGGDAEEGSIRFDNLRTSVAFPTVAITNSNISGGFTGNVLAYVTSGTLNRLSMTGNTFGLISATGGNDNVDFTTYSSATGNVTVSSNTFSGTRSDFFEAIANNNSVMDVVSRSNTFLNGQTTISGGGTGVSVRGDSLGTAATVTFDISHNNLTAGGANAFDTTGIFVAKGNGNGTMIGTIQANDIGPAKTNANADGIFVRGTGTNTTTVLILNNTLTGYGNGGIHLQNNDGSSIMNASVFGNSVTGPNASNFAGLFVDNGATGTDTSTMNIVVGSAVGGEAAKQNTLEGSGGVFDVELTNVATTTLNLSKNGSSSGTADGVIADDNLGTPTVDTAGTISLVLTVPVLPPPVAP